MFYDKLNQKDIIVCPRSDTEGNYKDKLVANENLRALYSKEGKIKPKNWQLRLINMKERCLWAK